jgi:hypothetical protein
MRLDLVGLDLRKEYAVGFKKSMKIVFDFDKVLPKWNYRAVPKPV